MKIAANKGMFLEKIINISNQYYLSHEICAISKNNLPIKILKMHNNIIHRAFIETQANCDYYGILNGKYIEFEAKETHKEFFMLSNILDHQWRRLEIIKKLGGVAFIIIYFHNYDQYFILSYVQLKEWKNLKIKKLSFSEIMKKGHKTVVMYPFYLNYVNIILEKINLF